MRHYSSDSLKSYLKIKKKRVGVIGNVITNFLGFSNPNKQHHEQKQKFLENLWD